WKPPSGLFISIITVFSPDFDTCYYRDIFGPAPVPQPILPVIRGCLPPQPHLRAAPNWSPSG
ncbi:mCG1030141, partial [Mus musculus]